MKVQNEETWQEVKDAVSSAEGLDPKIKEILLEGTIDKLTSVGGVTHHCGMVDAKTGEVAHEGLPENESALNIVRRFKIEKPDQDKFLKHSFYDYSKFSDLDRNVVPLECIVRFGITSGSSVFRKYLKLSDSDKRKFELELGANGPLTAWEYLTTPIVDFTSKYEPEARAVCVTYSGQKQEQEGSGSSGKVRYHHELPEGAARMKEIVPAFASHCISW